MEIHNQDCGIDKDTKRSMVQNGDLSNGPTEIVQPISDFTNVPKQFNEKRCILSK